MITLSQYAFRKLRWFRENCNENTINDTNIKNPSFLEVSLMGVSESKENLSKIVDFRCVPQECTSGTTEIDDDGLAIFFENMLEDENIPAILCGRVWAHTHPGKSPTPSSVDLDTWGKYFGGLDYAVMYILADGADYCRVRYSTNIFGIQQKDVSVNIELNSKLNTGEKMVIGTDTIFAIDKIFFEKEHYIGCADEMVIPVTDEGYISRWTKELKENVKKKTYKYTYDTTGTTTDYGRGTYIGGQKQIGFHDANRQWEKEQKERQEKETKQTKISPSGIIKLLVRNNKDNINQFSHIGIDDIVKAVGCTTESLYSAQQDVIKNESKLDWSELVLYEDDYNFVFENSDTKIMTNNVYFMDKVKLESLCVKLLVRRAKLIEMVDDYIVKMRGITKKP